MLACRPTLCLAVAVVLGICTRVYFPFPGELLGTLAAFLIPFTIWFLLSPRHEPPPPPRLPEEYRPYLLARPGFIARRGLNRFMVILAILAFFAGYSRQTVWERNTSPDRLPTRRWFTAVLQTITPNRVYPDSDGRWRCDALLETVDGQALREGLRVRVYGTDGETARRGDRIRARVRLAVPEAPEYPGAFDFRFYLNRDGLLAAVHIVKPRPGRDDPDFTVIPVESPPLHLQALRILDSIRGTAIGRTLRYGGEEGRLLAAMLFGYRDDISADIRDAFRRVGIGHVLAISGLHVGLVVGLLWWLGGWIAWPVRWRALVCLILALFYLGLTGGQVAAVRATTMASIHLLGIAMGRKSDMLNSLGAAALLLILLNPTAPLDVSFQLSFTAVLFIHVSLPNPYRWEYPPERRRRRNTWYRRRLLELDQLFRLSIATWVGLYPIIAAVFHQVNLAGLPINVLVIPLMSLVLAGGLLIPLLGWLPLVPDVLVFPTTLLTRLAVWTDGLVWSSVPAHPPDWRWTLLFYIGTGLFMLRGMIREQAARRRWVFASGVLVAVCFIGVTVSMRSSPPPRDGRVSLLPGAGGGVLVAESPEGGIALLGTVRRGGIREIGWLHQLRRSGAVGFVDTGNEADTDSDVEYADLQYHNGILERTVLQQEGEPFYESGWQPVPGAAGIDYAYGRDKEGRLVWLSARAGTVRAGVAHRISVPAFRSVSTRPAAGMDVRLLAVSFSDKHPRPAATRQPGQTVFVSGRYGRTMLPGWYERRDYGVLLVAEDGILGWNGEDWVGLP